MDPAPENNQKQIPLKFSLWPLAIVGICYIVVAAGLFASWSLGVLSKENLIFGEIFAALISCGIIGGTVTSRWDEQSMRELEAAAATPILDRRELIKYEGRELFLEGFWWRSKHRVLRCGKEMIHVDDELHRFAINRSWERVGNYHFSLNLTDFALWLDNRARIQQIREKFLKNNGVA